MLVLDAPTLARIVAQARADAAEHPRWLAAIARAARELESNPFIEVQDDHLLIASPSGNLYAANGICQCTAFAHGQPCWHRASARLVRRYNEAMAQQVVRPEYDEALAMIMECF